ncbi:SRPBCC family protein [Cellulomonas sp.]|uniref:SRPBCC family protein n=1 Tax=Cellulomonas sp. TaxID=40001 RepID=UPI001B12AEF4|nr:SRPBCC family protein [Cellulomonas sp.]MBO9556239.1 SRPBCC family protein [Cellulomonas sp.]
MTPTRRAAALGAAATAAVVAVPWARARARRWGATDDEVAVRMPGDDLVPEAGVVATRAVTIEATPEVVWQWLVQIGQDRGGFYSYDRLENLLGLKIRSANTLEDRWQDLVPGDVVRLADKVGLDVVVAEPGFVLVLAAPDNAFTWSFALRDCHGRTRLVARERYATPNPAVRVLSEVTSLVSAVMTRGMLLGIRDRAERTA